VKKNKTDEYRISASIFKEGNQEGTVAEIEGPGIVGSTEAAGEYYDQHGMTRWRIGITVEDLSGLGEFPLEYTFVIDEEEYNAYVAGHMESYPKVTSPEYGENLEEPLDKITWEWVGEEEEPVSFRLRVYNPYWDVVWSTNVAGDETEVNYAGEALQPRPDSDSYHIEMIAYDVFRNESETIARFTYDLSGFEVEDPGEQVIGQPLEINITNATDVEGEDLQESREFVVRNDQGDEIAREGLEFLDGEATISDDPRMTLEELGEHTFYVEIVGIGVESATVEVILPPIKALRWDGNPTEKDTFVYYNYFDDGNNIQFVVEKAEIFGTVTADFSNLGVEEPVVGNEDNGDWFFDFDWSEGENYGPDAYEIPVFAGEHYIGSFVVVNINPLELEGTGLGGDTTDWSTRPSDFDFTNADGLVFEKGDAGSIGKLVIDEAINLCDMDTVSGLSELGDNLIIAEAEMSLDTAAGALESFNVASTLHMYNLVFSTSPSIRYIPDEGEADLVVDAGNKLDTERIKGYSYEDNTLTFSVSGWSTYQAFDPPSREYSFVSEETDPVFPVVNSTFSFSVNVIDSDEEGIVGIEEEEFNVILADGDGVLELDDVDEMGGGEYKVTVIHDTYEIIDIEVEVISTKVGVVEGVVVRAEDDWPELVSPQDGYMVKKSTVDFEWNEMVGVENYEFGLFEDEELETEFATFTALNTSTSVYVMDEGTWYWSLKGKYSEEVYSDWAPAWKIIVDTTPPADVEVDIVEVSTHTVSLKASATDHFTGLHEKPFNFVVSKDEEFSSSQTTGWVEGDTYKWDKLVTGTTYWFRVQARDKVGNTAWSIEAAAETLKVELSTEGYVADDRAAGISMQVPRTSTPIYARVNRLSEEQEDKREIADGKLPEGAVRKVDPRKFSLRLSDGSEVEDYGSVLEGEKILIRFTYPDTLTNREVDRLRIVSLNENEEKWENVPLEKTTVRKPEYTIEAELEELSVYSVILEAAEADDVSDVFIYPNPLKPGSSDYGGADGGKGIIISRLPENSDIRIFNVAGELVDDFTSRDGGEYRWEKAGDIASGVYIMVIEHDGDVETVKFAVVK